MMRPSASKNELLWVSRISVVLVAIVVLIIAYNPESMVLELVAYAWPALELHSDR